MSANKIWLSSPHMGGREKEYVMEAFDSNWIAPLGPNVDGFERDIEDYLGNNIHAAALSSGTAALHLALIILGVSRGDDVICQSMTFSASANPIAYLGANPIFIESEDTTWNMSPEFLEKAIIDRRKKGGNIKAIIVVHLYGMPAQMDLIMGIAQKYQIPIIEDAAEALGSRYKGQPLGSFGDIGILSFNGNKIITTSGGGAFVTRNQAWVEKARFLATQARDPAPHYEHSEIGYNYRLSNISAGIGRGQMEVLPLRVQQRRKNFNFYRNDFLSYSKTRFQTEIDQDYFSNRWLTAILFDTFETREIVRTALAKENIESRPLWKPMHAQPVFQGAPFYGNNTSELLFQKGLCVPSGSNLTPADLDCISSTIKKVFI